MQLYRAYIEYTDSYFIKLVTYLIHSVPSAWVFGLGRGDIEKLNESHTFHSLASEFTTHTVRGPE